MQTIAETCVHFDAAHVSINLVSEIAVPMFPTLSASCTKIDFVQTMVNHDLVPRPLPRPCFSITHRTLDADCALLE